MKKLLTGILLVLIVLSGFAYMGYKDTEAMEVCQEKYSHDYCFRQIMR
jgi:hypothetical protein